MLHCRRVQACLGIVECQFAPLRRSSIVDLLTVARGVAFPRPFESNLVLLRPLRATQKGSPSHRFALETAHNLEMSLLFSGGQDQKQMHLKSLSDLDSVQQLVLKQHSDEVLRKSKQDRSFDTTFSIPRVAYNTLSQVCCLSSLAHVDIKVSARSDCSLCAVEGRLDHDKVVLLRC